MSNELTVINEQNLALEIKVHEFKANKAKMYASSSVVPAAYRQFVEVYDAAAKGKILKENPAAIANCYIVLDVAKRMGMDDLQVFQNLHIIEGRTTWASEFVAGLINECGKFSTDVAVEIKNLGKKVVDYYETPYGSKQEVKKSIEIEDISFVAYVYDKNGIRIDGPEVSVKMAVEQGWYQRKGSKWPTMPKIQGRHRAIGFLGRFTIPEILKGIKTTEEVIDFIEPSPDDIVAQQDDNGVYEATFVEEKKSAPEKLKEKLKAKVADKPEEKSVAAASSADDISFD